MNNRAVCLADEKAGTFFISQGLKREHKVTLELINKHRRHFLDLGGLDKRVLNSTGGRPTKEYLLNYFQLLFLISLMKNNKSSVEVKKAMIMKSEISSAIDIIKNFDIDSVVCRYVYAALDEHGRVKIGISNDPENRIKQLNIGNADKLTLVFTRESYANGFRDEVILHEKCDKFRIRGEWFSEDAMEVIEK